MPSIVLATLNARFHHCAFGLRYLQANMGPLADETSLLEFTINQPTLEILDAILAQSPRIVGLGIYIWNVEETHRLVADLKRVAPEVIVVLGGPEVSYEIEHQQITALADYVITGEADLAFAKLCAELIATPDSQVTRDARDVINIELEPENRLRSEDPSKDLAIANLREHRASGCAPLARIIHAPVPDLNSVAIPYELYSDHDISHRVIYVEASRGCPFTCEFCLSALDIPVRQFALEPFLAAMQRLLDRGARQFKFVDRTFNLNIRVSRAILHFFLERYQPGMFLHFELIPDRLPEPLQETIALFPPGALQFEVGIQTFNDQVSDLISRKQDNAQVEQNLAWLRDHTNVHVHADLIVGLPGESRDSFASGFDRLVRLGPHEIQVGILKRLRGTPIIRHDQAWQMVYSPHPPYEILRTSLLDFSTVQELRRFAKYWDTIANSGNFVETTPLLWRTRGRGPSLSSIEAASIESASEQVFSESSDNHPSPFAEFRRLANWLYRREGHSHGISLSRLVELLFEYLTIEIGLAPAQVAADLWRDYQRGGRSDKPACLRPYLSDAPQSMHSGGSSSVPKRQGRRLDLNTAPGHSTVSGSFPVPSSELP